MDIKRNLVAIVLIGLVIVLTPSYLRWVSPNPAQQVQSVEKPAQAEKNTPEKPIEAEVESFDMPDDNKKESVPEPLERAGEIILDVETDLYSARISNRGGGSFIDFQLKDYLAGYDDSGEYNPDIPVSLLLNNGDDCTPCLGLYDQDEKQLTPFNQYFTTDHPDGERLNLTGDEEKVIKFSLVFPDGRTVRKSILFKGNSYATIHDIEISGFEQTYRQDLEINWDGGIRPAQRIEKDDIQYSGAIMYQAGEKDDIMVKDEKPVSRKVFDGNTDWVAIKNKYFIVSMMTDTPGKYAALSGSNTLFGDRELTPVYTAGIGFDIREDHLSIPIYIGPQDYHSLKAQGHALDDAMNWGFAFIRPISKYVIYSLLKFLHNPFDDFYINYGLVLIIFALIIRIATGPLTRKSAESTQRMSALQPKMKAIQEKYKNDPQKKNSETMNLYREHGVNPVGGCLPMVIQMPLLFALFVVFRTTIEFRGAGFIFWIKDLSQPDVIFTLPFSIPIYGSGVAVLPIIMGVTMFLQQRQSMATMEKSQRPMMYMMSGFFFLLFNTFPSGLNLYYALYNFLSFLQQRSIKKGLAPVKAK